jgi:hypothetical protein
VRSFSNPGYRSLGTGLRRSKRVRFPRNFFEYLRTACACYQEDSYHSQQEFSQVTIFGQERDSAARTKPHRELVNVPLRKLELQKIMQLDSAISLQCYCLRRSKLRTFGVLKRAASRKFLAKFWMGPIRNTFFTACPATVTSENVKVHQTNLLVHSQYRFRRPNLR